MFKLGYAKVLFRFEENTIENKEHSILLICKAE